MILLQVAIMLVSLHSAQTAPTANTYETAKPETLTLLKKQFMDELSKPSEKTEIVMPEKEFKQNSCKLVYKTFVIKHPKCITEEIVLPVCYGQCNSMYFPGNNLKDTFGLCQSCQPTSKAYKVVVLNCPNAKQEHKKIRKRKIEYFKGCACRSCR